LRLGGVPDALTPQRLRAPDQPLESDLPAVQVHRKVERAAPGMFPLPLAVELLGDFDPVNPFHGRTVRIRVKVISDPFVVGFAELIDHVLFHRVLTPPKTPYRGQGPLQQGIFIAAKAAPTKIPVAAYLFL
jgi:hypothetical protein